MLANICGIAILLAAVLPTSADEPAGQAQTNLVLNGDFSQVVDGRPDRWETSGDPANVTQKLEAARDADGKSYGRLVCTRCERKSGWSHAMLLQLGGASIVKGRAYEFSCRLRAEGIRGRAVGLAIQETQGWFPSGLEIEVPVGEKWKVVRHTFIAARDMGPTARLRFYYTETGTLCVTDVRLVEVAAGEVEFTDLAPPGAGKNLVSNGSFEVGSSGWASMGGGAGWGDLDRLVGKIEPAGGAPGRSFLRISIGGESTPVLYFDYFEPVVRREFRPLAVSRGWIRIEKGAAYTLSCDLRASVEGTGAVFGARCQTPAAGWNDHKTTVKLTTAWKRYSLTFRPAHRFCYVFAGPDLAAEQRVDVDVDAIQLEKGDRATDFAPGRELELAVEPSQPAGIFFTGQPNRLLLRAFNKSAAAAKAVARFTVTDFLDKPVHLPPVTLDVPAGRQAQAEVTLPADWRGFYRVRASAEADPKAIFADLRLAIVPPRSDTDSVAGVNHAFVSGDLIDLAAKTGVTWYRDWSLKWDHIEPAKGTFKWEIGDTQIGRVLKRGVHVLPLLPPFPSADWSSDAPPGLTTTGYPGKRIRQAWGPKDPADLAAFIERAVGRYKGRIGIWEFLNEPVYTSYALPADRENKYGGRKYSPADYVALLATAAAAMRKADPGCKVMGGIAGGPGTLTREVLAAGCLKQLDIFNLHIYPGARTPEGYISEMDDLLKLMDANGGRKPIWMTEFSYYATDNPARRPFVPGSSSWAEQRLLDSERQCADFTIRFFVVMLSRGVEKIFIHSGASGRANEPNLECALFDYGGAPRKLAPALAVFTELLGGSPRFAGERRLGQFGHAVAFDTPRQSVLVCWSEDEAEGSGARVTIAGPPGLRRLDLMGRELPAGNVMPLSSSPAYVVGPPGAGAAHAKELLAAIGVNP